MKLYLRWHVNIVCLILAALMLRASFWQWERHVYKQKYLKHLEDNINQPIVDFKDLIQSGNLIDNKFRRVSVTGEFVFKEEMILRNRKLNDSPGVHVLTPLKITGTEHYVIVNRGFIPLKSSYPKERKQFQKTTSLSFIGLVKETVPPKLLAPQDPEPLPGNWVDAWLRVDLEKMQKQLSYKILPVYLEIMDDPDPAKAEAKIMVSTDGRDELFFLPARLNKLRELEASSSYPIPAHSTVVPAERHLGYVYEWAIMALATILIGIILQLRKKRENKSVVSSHELL